MFYRFLRTLSQILWRPFHRFKIYGKENMPSGRALVIGNHFANMDVIYLAQLTHDQLFFLAKKELFENRFMAWLCRKLGAYPVDREGADASAVMHGLKVLKNGKKLALFPEGTRNKSGTDEVQEIRSGAGVFAVKTKSVIVPCIQLRKARVFRRNYMIVGKPFELSEYYGVKLTKEVIDEMDKKIRGEMIALHEELKAILAAKKEKKGKRRAA